uniref:Uncharacterized protein n=1 Tax=Steinernema glaseri TaxID=37863 RepID=A0A1I8A4X4_9BILA
MSRSEGRRMRGEGRLRVDFKLPCENKEAEDKIHPRFQISQLLATFPITVVYSSDARSLHRAQQPVTQKFIRRARATPTRRVLRGALFLSGGDDVTHQSARLSTMPSRLREEDKCSSRSARTSLGAPPSRKDLLASLSPLALTDRARDVDPTVAQTEVPTRPARCKMLMQAAEGGILENPILQIVSSRISGSLGDLLTADEKNLISFSSA